ncbi:MAG: hypothetical protein ACLTDS_01795 [Bianqueaceae bacterium]
MEATVFDEATALLRGGQIVAFPTETVYRSRSLGHVGGGNHQDL